MCNTSWLWIKPSITSCALPGLFSAKVLSGYSTPIRKTKAAIFLCLARMYPKNLLHKLIKSSSIFSISLMTVWPYFGIKSGPNYSKSCQKVATTVLTIKWCFFNKSNKRWEIWVTFRTKFVTKDNKNRPIWSHWFLMTAKIKEPLTIPENFIHFFQEFKYRIKSWKPTQPKIIVPCWRKKNTFAI